MDLDKKPNLINLIERIRTDEKLSKEHPDVDMLHRRLKQSKHLLSDCVLSSVSLHDRYIISCKFKDNSTQYAMIDCGYPGWISELFMAKRFSSIDSAKKWFEDCKHYLMEEPYGNPNEIVDDSVKVQQIASIEVEDIKYETDSNTLSNMLFVIRAVSMGSKKEVFATSNKTNPWSEYKTEAILFKSITEAAKWLFANDNINYHISQKPDTDQCVLASSIAYQDAVTGDNISIWRDVADYENEYIYK